MRFEQLQYLATVTRHGSLRRASDQLHLSQPALSEAVSRLEQELGEQLLDRHRSGARLSRRGRELLPLMEEVLEAVERLRAAAGAGGVRTVRVGTVSAATSTLVAPAVRLVTREHGDIRVEVLNAQQDAIEVGLRESTLEVGLVNVLEEDPAPPGLLSVPLVEGRAAVVMRADHRLATREAIHVRELADEPFVAMREGYLMRRVMHRLFPGRMPPLPFTADGADLGKLMVAEGLGVTLLPDYSVTGDPLEAHGVLVHRPLADDDTRVTLSLWQRSGGRPTEATTALVAALGQAARGGPPQP